jgi:hypothetical protein
MLACFGAAHNGNHLHVGHVGTGVCTSGQGSPPFAVAGMLMDKVVASSKVSARMCNSFFTVGLLFQVNFTVQSV